MLWVYPAPYSGSTTNFFKTVAHHEAGHAVVCIRLGIAFRHVMLAADGTSHVKMWRRHGAKGSSAQRIEREIIMLLAGNIATKRYDQRAAGLGAHQDAVQAYTLAAGIVGVTDTSCPRTEKYMAGMRKRAAVIVGECWPQISAVAKELKARKRLEYSDVARICAAARA